MYPKLIEIGTFYLPTYGVLVALGFLAGLAVTVKLSRRAGLNPERMTNLAVYIALAGMLGAKLFMIAFDWKEYAAHPASIFSTETMQAAGVFQGGLILALITAFLYMRKQAMPILASSDTFAPGVAIGHAIGRLGCFAAGCCWGTECDLPWAVTFHRPEAWALTGVPLERPLHPAQLYESFAELLIFGYLWKRYNQPHPAGQILGEFLVISSIARFGIEFFRFHEQGLPFGLPLSITQWIALGLALVGVAVLVHVRKNGHDAPRQPAAQARMAA
ncbi:MAG: prolipoprotein diacylglyceryl transferase [Acidobacteriota bacterium]